MKTMLSKEPEDRPSAKEILQYKYIKHHILRMLGDIQNTTQREQRREETPSKLPSESEFTALSPGNSLNVTSIREAHSSEARRRRREKIATQRLSASGTMLEPITAVASNFNGLSSSVDELNVWERCPVEKLAYHFAQHEIQDKEDHQYAQMETELDTTSNSCPGTLNVNIKQEAINTVVRGTNIMHAYTIN